VVQTDPNDLILRTVATKLVRIALQCDALTAEMYSIDYMSERPPSEWRARFWSPQFEPTPGGVHWPLSLSEEFARILKDRFWRDVRNVQDGAHIQVNGSFAAYVGPLLMTPNWTEVTSQKGVIIPRSAIVSSTIRWWTEIHLFVIRLPLSPLVEVLRRDGGLVDMALDQLRKEGLLPIPPSRRHWVEEALNTRRPRKGENKKDWTERATPGREGTARNWLSRNDSVWRAYGGGAD
jgi:hypothetical protein